MSVLTQASIAERVNFAIIFIENLLLACYNFIKIRNIDLIPGHYTNISGITIIRPANMYPINTFLSDKLASALERLT